MGKNMYVNIHLIVDLRPTSALTDSLTVSLGSPYSWSVIFNCSYKVSPTVGASSLIGSLVWVACGLPVGILLPFVVHLPV
jgi:hypothetical protein